MSVAESPSGGMGGGGGGGLGNYNLRFVDKTPIPLDGDSATIQNFGQNDTNRNRNGMRAEEAPRS